MTSKPDSIWSNLRSLTLHISPRLRAKFVLVAILSLASAFAEMATLGIVVPFLAVLAGSNNEQQGICNHLMGLCSMDPSGVSKLFAGVVLIGLVLRLLALRVSTQFAFALGDDLGNEIYRRTLHQPYQFHVAHNTSQIMAGVNKAAGLVGNVVTPLTQGGIALISAISIFAALVSIDVLTALLAMSVFATFYVCISLTTKQTLKKYGVVIAKTEVTKIQALQEGLGGIRDILLDASQREYVQRLKAVNAEQSHARASIQFLQGSPRYVIEAAGIILIVILAWWINQRQGISAALPILGALALGAQRLLPQLQQIYIASTSLHGGQAVIRDVVELLNLPLPDDEVLSSNLILPVAQDTPIITLNSVCFYYQTNGKKVLNNISLKIDRGSRIGFIGKTGSGKSTLVDLIMGLLNPTGGQLIVDTQVLSDINRRSWYRRIAHVPQAIYLSDATLAENIAFGVDFVQINMQRVQMAAQKAQLSEFIKTLPDKYLTHVGERGVRLSGGQRQRIGLARALYKQADILVLDEATSALDDTTENAVMEAVHILGADVTVLMIAHRLSTLRNCDTIYELDRGRVVRFGSYQDIIG